MKLFTTPPDSICILRLSAIGDTLNVIPLVNAIHTQWPTTKITWIIGASEYSLLKEIYPQINFIVFNKKDGFKGYLKIWKKLRHLKFTALLHLQTALRANILTLGIRAQVKLGFDKVRCSDMQSLFTNYKVCSPKNPHVVAGFMQFAASLGIDDITPKWNIGFSQSELNTVINKFNLPDSFFILAPSASKSYKNWTLQGYKDIVSHALGLNIPVVLTGSPSPAELKLCGAIAADFKGQIINLAGKTSLYEMLIVIKLAKCALSADSAPAHMASLLNTPVVGLYAHHDPLRVGPYNYLKYIVSAHAQLALSATGKERANLNWRYRVKDPAAMSYISSKEVIIMLNHVFKKVNLISEK